jgi:uncharacterized protein (TIGR02246 family)
MPANPPSIIETLVRAMNAHDSDAFVALFAEQAVARDEGQEYQGRAAIKAWIEEAFRKYRPKLETVEIAAGLPETAFTATVSGTFEGSPVRLFHRLGIEQGQITSMTITPE